MYAAVRSAIDLLSQADFTSVTTPQIGLKSLAAYSIGLSFFAIAAVAG